MKYTKEVQRHLIRESTRNKMEKVRSKMMKGELPKRERIECYTEIGIIALHVDENKYYI